MDAPKPTPPLQSFFRFVIMAGTLAVGAMAFKVYGPPPEKMAPIVERVKSVAISLANAAMASLRDEPAIAPTPTTPALPAPSTALPTAAPAFANLTTSATLAAPTFAAPPIGESAFPPVVTSRSTVERSRSVAAALASDPSLAPLVTQLEAAGVDRLELAVWGDDGRLVRGSCTAPMTGSAFRRVLDTIEASPRAALEGLIARLQPGGAIAQAY